MSEKSKKKPQASFWQIAVPLWFFTLVSALLIAINFIPIGEKTVVEYLTVTNTPQYYGTPRVDHTFIEPLTTATPLDNEIQVTVQAEFNINTMMCQYIERSENGQFVFRMFPQGATGMDLFRVDEDGSNFCRLTNNLGADDYPVWSPDGEQIAYVSVNGEYGLYLINADGTNIELLHTGGTAYSHPTWSPDGQFIIFQATFDEVFDIYRLELATGEIINLTNQERLDNMPAYSPDGQFIVFTSDRTFNPYIDTNLLPQGQNYEIYMMNSDGMNPRRLTVNVVGDGNPSFSPDSSQIVFGSGWDVISIMNRDGSGLGELTNGFHAIWLSDGRIAYVAGGIYTIMPDGSENQAIIESIPIFGSGIQQIDYTAAR